MAKKKESGTSKLWESLRLPFFGGLLLLLSAAGLANTPTRLALLLEARGCLFLELESAANPHGGEEMVNSIVAVTTAAAWICAIPVGLLTDFLGPMRAVILGQALTLTGWSLFFTVDASNAIALKIAAGLIGVARPAILYSQLSLAARAHDGYFARAMSLIYIFHEASRFWPDAILATSRLGEDSLNAAVIILTFCITVAAVLQWYLLPEKALVALDNAQPDRHGSTRPLSRRPLLLQILSPTTIILCIISAAFATSLAFQWAALALFPEFNIAIQTVSIVNERSFSAIGILVLILRHLGSAYLTDWQGPLPMFFLLAVATSASNFLMRYTLDWRLLLAGIAFLELTAYGPCLVTTTLGMYFGFEWIGLLQGIQDTLAGCAEYYTYDFFKPSFSSSQIMFAMKVGLGRYAYMIGGLVLLLLSLLLYCCAPDVCTLMPSPVSKRIKKSPNAFTETTAASGEGKVSGNQVTPAESAGKNTTNEQRSIPSESSETTDGEVLTLAGRNAASEMELRSRKFAR